MFSATWLGSDTEPVPDFSQLVRWVRHTCVSGCSFWPTPLASDANRGGLSEQGLAYRLSREQQVRLSEVVGGPVNPEWTEWLMGFPPGWTDLEDSATPSSLPSPNTSDG